MDLKKLSKIQDRENKAQVRDARRRVISGKKSQVLDRIFDNDTEGGRIADSVLSDSSIRNLILMDRNERRKFIRNLPDSDRRKVLVAMKRIKDDELETYSGLAKAMENWILEGNADARRDLDTEIESGKYSPEEEAAIKKVRDLEPMPADDWVDTFKPLKDKFTLYGITVPPYALLQDSAIMDSEDEDDEPSDLDKVINGNVEHSAFTEALRSVISATENYLETGSTEQLNEISESVVADSLRQLCHITDDEGNIELSEETLQNLYKDVEEYIKKELEGKVIEVPDSFKLKSSQFITTQAVDTSKITVTQVPLTHSEFHTLVDIADTKQVFEYARRHYTSAIIPIKDSEVIPGRGVRITNGKLIQDWVLDGDMEGDSVRQFIKDHGVLASDFYRAAAQLGKYHLIDSSLYKKRLSDEYYCSDPCEASYACPLYNDTCKESLTTIEPTVPVVIYVSPTKLKTEGALCENQPIPQEFDGCGYVTLSTP